MTHMTPKTPEEIAIAEAVFDAMYGTDEEDAAEDEANNILDLVNCPLNGPRAARIMGW